MLHTTPLRVLVDHGLPIVRAGLAAGLKQVAHFDVVVRDPLDAPRASAMLQHFDVIVADRRAAIVWLAQHKPAPRNAPAMNPRVLIVDDADGEAELKSALHAGAHGYVLTDCAVDELLHGVDSVGRGGRYLAQPVANRYAASLARAALTPRETHVLCLMVDGHSNKLIARELDIALGTVKVHAKVIYAKLGVNTRSQAVALANEIGLIPPSVSG